MDIRVAALGDRPRTVTLRKIEIQDISGKAGATPEGAARQIIGAIINEVGKEVVQALMEANRK